MTAQEGIDVVYGSIVGYPRSAGSWFVAIGPDGPREVGLQELILQPSRVRQSGQSFSPVEGSLQKGLHAGDGLPLAQQ